MKYPEAYVELSQEIDFIKCIMLVLYVREFWI